MDFFDYLSRKMKKNKTHNYKRAYKKLIKETEINDIINNMPENLTQIEKAYYIYLELGKLITENTEFVFGDWKTKSEHYNDRIDEKFSGICKSISELYSTILADERIGIDCDVVKQYPDREITHVDNMLKIDGNNYLVNLIIDLSNIKFGKRTNGFAFDMEQELSIPILQAERELYYERLEEEYGEIYSLSNKEMQKMDKKLNYSFFLPEFMEDNSRGIYSDDTIEIIKYELRNKEKFNDYILKGKNVPDDEIIKYKLDFIFENKCCLVEDLGRKDYLENIRCYNKLFKSFLTDDEYSRVTTYAAVVNNDLKNIISILKVKQYDEADNLYYLYNKDQDKYEEKTPKEMKEFLKGLDKDSLKIIGNLDRRVRTEFDELEL